MKLPILPIALGAVLTCSAGTIPVVDISGDANRQVVVAAGTRDRYEGHPTTLLAEDGMTIFCVWTTGHGGPCGPMARSEDGGLHWARMDKRLPAAYGTHRNCPTLQKVKDSQGNVRYCIYSAKTGNGSGLGILYSDDFGRTWQESPWQAHISAGMPPTGFMQLKDGTCALFGQVRHDPKVKSDRPTDDQDVWMSVSTDGGLTWGEMRTVAHVPNRNLCEPCCLRSPDGSKLCLLMRENRHRGNSMMAFSSDEGKTWSEPIDTPWALTGDRHEAVLLPDGRYVIAFRDQAVGSPTRGQYTAWVGTWDDIAEGREGQYRIRLLHHHGLGDHFPGADMDTGYSGVELLPDGTIVCTTYSRHFDDARQSSVVSTRFRIEETDALAKPLIEARARRGEPRKAAMEPLPLGAVRAEGWLLRQLEMQRDGLTGHAEELYEDIGRSDWLTHAGKGGEFAWERGPYYAKGLVSLAFVLDDAALKEKAKRWVDAILASQRENGDFGPRNRNWWANMIALLLVRDWAEATGDGRVVPFLGKYFAFQRKEFVLWPLAAESKWAVARAGDEVDVALWLYRRTGKAEHLAFARTVADQSADWTTYCRRGGDPAGQNGMGCRSHIVNFMQGLKTPALKWLLDGDEKDRGAYAAAFADDGWLMRLYGRPDRMLNGSEPLADRSASQGTELCAIAERILSCQTAMAALGDVGIADDLESVAYNSLPATVADDGRGVRYYCLLNQPECRDRFLLFANNGDRAQTVGAICPGPHAGFGCCRSNWHFAWPKFVQSMWMRKDNGLAIVAYGASTVKTTVGGRPVELKMETRYPFSGKVTVRVEKGQGKFPVFLRIPGWCGLEDAGRFRRYERDWREGDSFDVEFPMEVRTSFWEHDAVAVSRGPLLYALKMDAVEKPIKRYKEPYSQRWVEDFGKGFPRKELIAASSWGWALVLDGGRRPAFSLDESGAVPELKVKAVRTDFGGWGHMRDVANGRAIDPPPSPVPDDGAGVKTVTLVPFGLTQVRVALFPWVRAR